MDAIELIRQAQEQAKLKARANFLILADVLAKDEPPPADVLDILSRAGMTADQLGKLVTVAKERLSLEPRAAAFHSILADRAKADAELRAVDAECLAELETLRAKHTARIAPLRQKVADLEERERDSRSAKQRLQTLAGVQAKAEGRPNPNTLAGAVALMADSEEE